MFRILADLATRPPIFSRYTAERLWTDPHIAGEMLRHHLDPDSSLASRPPVDIDRTVAWLDEVRPLAGVRLCDLGCGPGLYTARFHDRGAAVTGVDWSVPALDHATAEARRAGRSIRYQRLNYVTEPLPRGFDLVTLIYCDFGALSPAQRATLLGKVRRALNPGGRLVLDVLSACFMDRFEAGMSIERRMMNGFWAPGDYVGLRCSYRYPDQPVTLDRYVIVEPQRHWEVFNWVQHFTPAMLTDELRRAGFVAEHVVGSLAGDEFQEDGDVIGVVARVD